MEHLSPAEPIEMLLPPLSPSSVHRGLGKRGSFLSCELGTVSDLSKVQFSQSRPAYSPLLQKAQRCSMYSALTPTSAGDSARSEGIPIPKHPLMTFPTEENSDLPCFSQARICWGESGKWHFPYWQGMAVSVPTTIICSPWVSEQGGTPQESRPLKE